VKRLVVLLVGVAAVAAATVVGATGRTTVAVAGQGTFPPGGQSTHEGQFLGISCGTERIVDPVATYYDKHANVVEVTQPVTSAVNPYGDVISAIFLTPKKAVYVVFRYTCAPLTQVPTPPATSSPTPTPPPASETPGTP
jgi:hypothetical protein